MTIAVAFKPLTKEDIADVLGISLRTVENWVTEGTLLPPKKIGTRVYWHPSAFYAWLDQCLTGTDATDAPSTMSAPESMETDGNAKGLPRKKTAKEAKTELSSLRSRGDAKLEALLNPESIGK